MKPIVGHTFLRAGFRFPNIEKKLMEEKKARNEKAAQKKPAADTTLRITRRERSR